jgi:uncharacterized protein DUF6580
MNWLAFLFVAAGVLLRVVSHPWNFAPVGAIALFGGAHFERRWLAIVIPLATMFIGDCFIGLHSLMPVIYATYALIAVLGMLLREKRTSFAFVGGASLLSSTIFYLTTNFAVWQMGTTYAHNAAGLVQCYVAAIPYFGNTIASDLLFTGIFFSVYGGLIAHRLAAAERH